MFTNNTMFINVHNDECEGGWLHGIGFVYLQGKIKVMTVNPTVNHHLLLENRLNQLLRDGQLSKDVWNDLINCVTLHRQLEFKQLIINK